MKQGKDCIGVFVTAILHDKEGNFLMARRGGAARDNHGCWDFGGGTVEIGETLESALSREIKEEFGTLPTNLKKVDTREFIDENGHWIGVFFVGEINRDEVSIVEPVYDQLGWFTLSTLPSPMMSDDGEHIEAYIKQF